MEEKKWIIIEKSLETVRYKVGDSDSSMDSQDFEYIPTADSPPPSYEIIPSQKYDVLSGDELEIHDNHFSSCPTSEMEDSDIEVIMKSPSTSDTASLCSLNSAKSIPNVSSEYDGIVFNVGTENEEEEDSEVEVISRSIHRNGSIAMSYVEDISDDVSTNMSASGSENEEEIEEEIEETTTAKCNYSPAPEVVLPEEEEEEECHVQSMDGTCEVNYVKSIEDYGIKYLLEDLHVSRQINSRLVGLKTSTLALTVCLSITLGIYLGNYFNPMSNGEDSWDDTILVPEDVIHSTAEDPLSVNIIFKYSSSTKESLTSVLHSFRKLKDDYDRLHTAYADMKEKCYRKKRMTVYWRKQVKKNAIERKKKNVTADDILKVNPKPDTVLRLIEENILNDEDNTSYQTHQMTIRKLSRDLKTERKSAMYWRKKYTDVELSKNTCSKYDGPQSSYFSFSDCFNIFSNVLPSLDISAINITNPAENLADQVHNAWSRLKSRWNAQKERDDPVDLRKVNRFRKIFIISNVVNSDSLVQNHIYTKMYENGSFCHIPSDIDLQLHFNINFTRKSKEGESLEKENVVTDVESHGDKIVVNSTIPVYPEPTKDKHNGTYNRDIRVQSPESMYRIDWFRNKYQEYRFLFDIFRWKNSFKDKIDMLKSRRITYLANENEKRSRQIEELYHFEKENVILRKQVKDSDEYLENTQSKMKYLVASERQMCNSSITKANKTMRRRHGHFVESIQNNVRKAERCKYNKRVRILMANERRRHYLSYKNVRKSIRKKEQTKFKKKLHEMKEVLKRDQQRYHKKLRYRHNLHRHQKIRLPKNKKDHRRKARHGKETHKELRRKNKRRGRSDKRKYARERRLKKRLSDYAKKYRHSARQVWQLREMYSESIKKTKKLEQVVKNYEDKEEKYKEIIEEYERKINEFLEKEKRDEAERLNDYNKLLRENAMLKRSVAAFTEATNIKNELNVEVNKNVNGQEVLEAVNHSETAKDYMIEISDGKCHNGMPFYNINDVYPKDLFKNVNINPPGPPRAPTMLPNYHNSPSFEDQHDHLNLLNSQTVQEKFLESSPFSEELAFSGTNESISDNEEVHLYWNEGRMELNKHNENKYNWYINWAEEKNENRKQDTFDSVPEKEGSWFWKSMKEREKLRSSEGEMNWFWKAMEEKKKRRSSQGEINWFWKMMKEREKRRSYQVEVNWFWKIMKEREKLRGEEEES